MKQTRQQQREVAQLLYLSGSLRQKEIALKLGVSENTVSRWAKADNWDTLKTNLLTAKKQRLSELYNELKEFNRMIAEKDGYKVADSKEADARRKLITDIKELETKYSLAQTITIGEDFCEFVKQVDYTLAEKVMELYNGFINAKIEENKWQE